MRPIRLELSGFAAFRDPVVVDFAGCDFFALCGPTGAGKTTVIDAITFALYGAIPRLDRNDVGSVIRVGELEAKVRLDFSIGEARYTAVRVVARTPRRGATTREARLERDGEVLAGDAKAVTAEVGRLIGLSFEQFTKCVVLPQGEFARFLHDTPGERQKLLVTLLDLEMYRRIGARSREQASAAEATAALHAHKVADLAEFATEQARIDADARLAAYRTLRDLVETEGPAIDALDAAIAAAQTEAQTATERAARLEAVRIPPGARAARDAFAGARERRDAAAAAADAEDAAVAGAERACAALPDRGALERARDAHDGRTHAAAALEEARADGTLAGDAEARAGESARDAEAALASAEQTRESLRLVHRAAEIARSLVTGEDCPVCGQVVATLPERHLPQELDAADAAVATARARRDAAVEAQRAAERARAAADARAASLASRVAELDAAVAGHPDPTAVARLLAEGAHADGALAAARERAGAARRALGEAQKIVDAAERSSAEAARAFDAARDAVADAGPPVPGRSDLLADWEALAGWAQVQAAAQRAAVAAAEDALGRARTERRDRAAVLLEAARSAGLEPRPGEPLRDTVLRAQLEQEAVVERLESALKEIEAVAADQKAAQEQHQVAMRLGQHLSARGFEKWLLDDALGRLVHSAGQRLRELCGGDYSLTTDDKGGFVVIDHRNADERRPAETLSGGETFLASLALALALAEDLAQMATQGVRLDAIFLDEGFGTLDPEALGVVASAIETLAAEGRMIGLVTHVREIAERVPVRFDVHKLADTSRIERVDA